MKCFDLKKFFASWREELVGLAVLVGVVSLVLLVLWLFRQVTFVEQEVTIVQILTGLLVLVGLYWTSRRVLAAEETVRVAEEGHITDRFTKAITQLGEKEMAIRLGGIYALERIAKDSEKDHRPIMEVLTAYVREKAIKQGQYAEDAAINPTTDIQAILTVIGRRKTVKAERVDDFLDLRNTHLAGAKLIDANLSEVILHGANLSKAILHGAILSKAILSGANLSGVSLCDVNLSGVSLSDVNLSGANLSGANLSGSKNLTAEQVREATNWREAILPDDLQYLCPEPPPRPPS